MEHEQFTLLPQYASSKSPWLKAINKATSSFICNDMQSPCRNVRCRTLIENRRRGIERSVLFRKVPECYHAEGAGDRLSKSVHEFCVYLVTLMHLHSWRRRNTKLIKSYFNQYYVTASSRLPWISESDYYKCIIIDIYGWCTYMYIILPDRGCNKLLLNGHFCIKCYMKKYEILFSVLTNRVPLHLENMIVFHQ